MRMKQRVEGRDLVEGDDPSRKDHQDRDRRRQDA
jgi:hypothetical protein